MGQAQGDVVTAAAQFPAGRHDHAQRRQSQRNGRERGCWVYLPAEQLVRTGVDIDGPAPLYRVWGSSRGRVVLQLYKSQ